MDKEEIVDLLEQKHQELFNYLEAQDPEGWANGPEGKWTTGQHILHLLETSKIVNTALSLPKLILSYKYGKSNRSVRDYETVTNRYQERLASLEPGATYQPSKPKYVPVLKNKTYLKNRLHTECKKLQYKTRKWSDKALDTYIVPHPIMGKMPVREILMWSAYHIEHHTKILREKY